MTNLRLTLVMACALFGLTRGAVDGNKNHIHDSNSHASSFSPSNVGTGHLNVARTVPVYAAHAQNRDSYANAASQAGYGAPSQGGGSVGAPTAAANVAAASSISSAYGVPASGGSSGGYSGGSSGGYAGGAAGGYGAPAGPGAGPGQSMTYYYYHYPGAQQAAAASMGNGWGAETTGYGDDEEGGLGGLGGAAGGLGGLAGLIGLKGLKGLGGLGLLALLKLLKPLLLPLLLPFLLLLPLLLLFLPIPVITIPSTGRSIDAYGIGDTVFEKVSSGVQVAQDVLTSSQCIERMACEINRRSQGTYVDTIINGIYEKTENYLSKKWRRGMRAYIDAGFLPDSGNKCAKFSCDMYKELSSRLETSPTAKHASPPANSNSTVS